jgi:hypothetical protein
MLLESDRDRDSNHSDDHGGDDGDVPALRQSACLLNRPLRNQYAQEMRLKQALRVQREPPRYRCSSKSMSLLSNTPRSS